MGLPVSLLQHRTAGGMVFHLFFYTLWRLGLTFAWAAVSLLVQREAALSSHDSWYIAIEGAIGVGKTTLARMLGDHFDAGLLLEVFEENPFLSRFYEDRARYSFPTQMFFLLSRYRQQRRAVPDLLERVALVSDYIFAKDWLFAHLNLEGDEWEMYQRVHHALAEQIPTPDLVIYLQADTAQLMARIAQRDRPYERGMDRGYIESVNQAYEHFFASYQEAPVLYVDTNQLNLVTDPAGLQSIVDRIHSAFQEGTFQRPLPHFESPPVAKRLLGRGRPLGDLQRFHVELDKAKHFDTDLYLNYLFLSEEMGELGSEFAKLWLEEAALAADGKPAAQARREVLRRRRPQLESELADCMAYLLKIANYAGVDLEAAYLSKMEQNWDRSWRESPKVRAEGA